MGLRYILSLFLMFYTTSSVTLDCSMKYITRDEFVLALHGSLLNNLAYEKYDQIWRHSIWPGHQSMKSKHGYNQIIYVLATCPFIYFIIAAVKQNKSVICRLKWGQALFVNKNTKSKDPWIINDGSKNLMSKCRDKQFWSTYIGYKHQTHNLTQI